MTPAELKSITRFDIPQSTLHNPKMIRLREIEDEKLREQVRAKIAEFREMMPGEIPDWWELDDADFS
ncbi:MAG TPA: hypothetical protein PK402_12295, partial [Tepidisphaeraceae bacterium]|nr:hypothetical protein [Tepidisphaeraceae bacterium]